MSASVPIRSNLAANRPETAPFFKIGNEVIQVFLPLVGSDCFTVYAVLRCQEFKNRELRHSVRALAKDTGLSAATVARALELLSALGLLTIIRHGGCQESTCQLADSATVAASLGARYSRGTVAWSLPEESLQALQERVKTLRSRSRKASASVAIHENRPVSVSTGNAKVSCVARQHDTAETQTPPHLLQEERRRKELPSPTPCLNAAPLPTEAQVTQNPPNEKALEEQRQQASALFTGVIDELRDHLLDTSRPPQSHLANGADDWQNFCFNTLAVEDARRREEKLWLTLSASDPAAAQRGLAKYQRKWSESLQAWFGCSVNVEVIPQKAASWLR